MTILKITDQDLAGKRVLIRADMNVPQADDGSITDDTRIRASLTTINYCLEKGAAVIVMSHLGKPTEGKPEPKFLVAPIATRLSELLEKTVPVVADWQTQGVAVTAGNVVMLENVRFNVGEKKNADDLAQAYASLCDIFVHDAFGTAHRTEASTHGVAKFAKIACAGILLSNEFDALSKALLNPARPLVAIVGGSKVSTKLTVLDALASKVDQLIVGGGISNTFVAAKGNNVGNSLYEIDMIPVAQSLMEKTTIVSAVDVTTTTDGFKQWGDNSPTQTKGIDQVVDGEEIIDYGPKTVAAVSEILKNAKTILWNGPVGVFEITPFSKGTEAIGRAIAESDAFSLAGGGDTLAAIAKYGLTEQISYISTGGGAFLEFVEGKVLPAFEILEQRAAG